MKTEIAVAAGMLVLALSAPAAASPREYNRGYYDCSNGRFDEDARAAPTGRAAGTPSANRGSRAARDGVTTATGRAMGARDPDGARTAADGTAASRGLRARRAFPTFRA